MQKLPEQVSVHDICKLQ